MTIKDNEGLSCYVLEDYAKDDLVENAPVEYWVLDLFYIVLDDSEGALDNRPCKYLVLEYPSYSEKKSEDGFDRCIWTPPYSSLEIEEKKTIMRYKRIGDILSYYDEKIKSNEETLNLLDNYRLYQIGLISYTKDKGRTFTEYKRSARQPENWKCYHIREFFIHNIDAVGLLNMCDPEGLHCYRYLPLNESEKKRIKEGYDFQGKPLASNVVNLICNSYNKLIEKSNIVKGDMLRYSTFGMVFSIDIIGFTEIYNKIVEEMYSFDESGKELALRFVAGISNIFAQNMKKNNIPNYQVSGDGIIGIIPFSKNNDERKIDDLLNILHDVKSEITKITSIIGKETKIRCSALIGECVFGKIAGLQSNSQINGDIMIKVCRMDEYAKGYIKNMKDEVGDWDIAICLANNIDVSDKVLENDMKEVDKKDKFRETIISSSLYIYKDKER